MVSNPVGGLGGSSVRSAEQGRADLAEAGSGAPALITELDWLVRGPLPRLSDKRAQHASSKPPHARALRPIARQPRHIPFRPRCTRPACPQLGRVSAPVLPTRRN